MMRRHLGRNQAPLATAEGDHRDPQLRDLTRGGLASLNRCEVTTGGPQLASARAFVLRDGGM